MSNLLLNFVLLQLEIEFQYIFVAVIFSEVEDDNENEEGDMTVDKLKTYAKANKG